MFGSVKMITLSLDFCFLWSCCSSAYRPRFLGCGGWCHWLVPDCDDSRSPGRSGDATGGFWTAAAPLIGRSPPDAAAGATGRFWATVAPVVGRPPLDAAADVPAWFWATAAPVVGRVPPDAAVGATGWFWTAAAICKVALVIFGLFFAP